MTSLQPSKSFEMTLNQFAQSLQEFYDLLESEKQAIRGSDSTQLMSIAEQKDHLSDQIETQFQALDSVEGFSFSELLQSDSIKSSYPQSIQRTLNEVESLIQACHDLNTANGMSLNILNNINRVSLEMLSGKDPDHKTYGKKGTPLSGKPTGRSIGKA